MRGGGGGSTDPDWGKGAEGREQAHLLDSPACLHSEAILEPALADGLVVFH